MTNDHFFSLGWAVLPRMLMLGGGVALLSCSPPEPISHAAPSGQNTRTSADWLSFDRKIRAIRVELEDNSWVTGYVIGSARDDGGVGIALALIPRRDGVEPVRAMAHALHLPDGHEGPHEPCLSWDDVRVELKEFSVTTATEWTTPLSHHQLVVVHDCPYFESLPQFLLHRPLVLQGTEVKLVTATESEEFPIRVQTAYVADLRPEWERGREGGRAAASERIHVEAISKPAVGAAVFETSLWSLIGFVVSEEGEVELLSTPVLQRTGGAPVSTQSAP